MSIRTRAALVFGLGLGLTGLIALSTYTQPWLGEDPYGGVTQLLHDALHDSVRPPVSIHPASGLPFQTIALPASAESGAPRAVATERRYDPRLLSWAAEAVRRDSAGLRAWLGPAVFVTARRKGDTVWVTLRRLTVTGHCPVLSTLHAGYRSSGPTGQTLVEIATSCPPMESVR